MRSILHFFLKGKAKFLIEIWTHLGWNQVKSITNPQYTKVELAPEQSGVITLSQLLETMPQQEHYI